MLKVEHIRWIDSESVDGWQSKEFAEGFAGEPGDPYTTVGIVMSESETYLAIGHSVSGQQATGLLRIPKVSIVERVVLAEVADVEE